MTDTNILNPGSFITIRFKSQPPATRFAPEWDFHIGEKNIVESVDVDSLTTYLLEQEKVIVEKYPAGSDGSTKLGPKSVTARFQHFNLMAFASADDPCRNSSNAASEHGESPTRRKHKGSLEKHKPKHHPIFLDLYLFLLFPISNE